MGICTTRIYLSAKTIFGYVKDLFFASTSRNFLSPAVNFVSLWPKDHQRIYIAVLRVRAKFMRILSDSVRDEPLFFIGGGGGQKNLFPNCSCKAKGNSFECINI